MRLQEDITGTLICFLNPVLSSLFHKLFQNLFILKSRVCCFLYFRPNLMGSLCLGIKNSEMRMCLDVSGLISCVLSPSGSHDVKTDEISE